MNTLLRSLNRLLIGCFFTEIASPWPHKLADECKRTESEYSVIIVHQWVVCGAGSLRSWSDVISSRDRTCDHLCGLLLSERPCVTC